MNAARRLHIGVVGAAIAGLASAARLARDGHRVTLYERSPGPRGLGSGLMLQPRGLTALQRLGLRQGIEELGQRIDGIRGLTAAGRPIFDPLL